MSSMGKTKIHGFLICLTISISVTWDLNHAVVNAQVGTQQEVNYSLEGIKQFQRSNYEAALKNFDREIIVRPENTEAYYYRGLIYAQYAEGKAPASNKTLPCRSNEDPVQCNLRWSEENRLNAIQEFTKAIEKNLQYAEAYHQRSLLQDDEQQRTNDLNKATDLYLSQGETQLRLNKYEQAANVFDKIYMLTGINTRETGIQSLRSPQKLCEEAKEFIRRGNIQAALDKYRQAASLFKADNKLTQYAIVQRIIKELEKNASR